MSVKITRSKIEIEKEIDAAARSCASDHVSSSSWLFGINTGPPYERELEKCRGQVLAGALGDELREAQRYEAEIQVRQDNAFIDALSGGLSKQTLGLIAIAISVLLTAIIATD